MHPIGNFAADDRSPELQVGKLSTISSADRIFIHRVLLQGKDRHLLGSAMVRHTVPPCFTIYTSHQSVKGSISNFSSLFAALEFAADCVARNKLSFRLIFPDKMRNARNWIYFEMWTHRIIVTRLIEMFQNEVIQPLRFSRYLPCTLFHTRNWI